MKKNASALLVLTICLGTTLSGFSHVGIAAETGTWRLSSINNLDSHIDLYHYDENGNLAEIVLMWPDGTGEEDDPYFFSTDVISFDETGAITDAQTDDISLTAEVLDAKSWALKDEFMTLTWSLTDQYQIENQSTVVKDSYTADTKYVFENGLAVSSVEESTGSQSAPPVEVTYEYEFDSNGNPIVRYAVSDKGKQINATYSWELAN